MADPVIPDSQGPGMGMPALGEVPPANPATPPQAVAGGVVASNVGLPKEEVPGAASSQPVAPQPTGVPQTAEAALQDMQDTGAAGKVEGAEPPAPIVPKPYVVPAPLAQSAATAEVNPNTLMKIAGIESGNGAASPNVFQIQPSTAEALRQAFPSQNFGDPSAPGESARMAPFLLKQNDAAFQAALGRPPTPGEQHLQWFAGAQGGVKVMTADPNTPISQILDPQAIARNPGIFNHVKTAGDLRNWADTTMGEPPSLTKQPVAGFDPSTIQDISSGAHMSAGQLDGYKGFIFHHTAGGGDANGVVNTLNQRGLGTQWVMDRDGKVYRTLPNEAKGYQILPSEIQSGAGAGLSNSNTEGMEVIAKDNNDVTPAQVASAKAFANWYSGQHPGVQFFGHGEVNPSHKMADEGAAEVSALRDQSGQGANWDHTINSAMISRDANNQYAALANPITVQERQQAAAAKAANGMGLVSAVYEANRKGGLLENVIRDGSYATTPEQPGYTATPAMIKADTRTADIDPEEVASLGGSRSPQEYEMRLADLKDDAAYQKRVDDSGLGGWLGSKLGTLVDPSNALFALMPELGASTAIGKFLVKGAEGAAVGAGYGAYDQRRRSDMDWQSLAWSSAMGAGLGMAPQAIKAVHPLLRDTVAATKVQAESYAQAVAAKFRGASEKEAMEAGLARTKAEARGPAPVVNGEAGIPMDPDAMGSVMRGQARLLDTGSFDHHDALSDTLDQLKVRTAQGEEGLQPRIDDAQAQLTKLGPKLEQAFKQAEEASTASGFRPADLGAGAVDNTPEGRVPVRDDTAMWTSPEAKAMTDRYTPQGVAAVGRRYLDIGGGARMSRIPIVKEIMSKLVGIKEGLADHSAAPRNATETSRRVHEANTAEVMRSGEANYQTWKKDKANAADSSRRQFSDQVKQYRGTRDPTLAGEFHENVRKAGDALTKRYMDDAELQNNPGRLLGEEESQPLRGAKPPNKFYDPHILDESAVNGMSHLHTDDRMSEALGNAFAKEMESRGKPVDNDTKVKAGKAYWDAIKSVAAGQEVTTSRMLNGDDLDALRVKLRKAGIDSDTVKEIVDPMEQPAAGEPTEGTTARLKSAMPLDLTHSEYYFDKASKSTKEIRISDLYGHDAYGEYLQYSRSTSGWIGAALMRLDNPLYNAADHGIGGAAEGAQKPITMDGIRSQSDIDKIYKQVRDQGVQLGLPKAQIENDVARIKMAMDHLLGRMEDSDRGTNASLLRGFLGLARSVFLGKTGIMHLAQYSHSFSELGVTSGLKAMPTLGGLIKDALTGNLRDPATGLLNNATARMLEGVTGQGSSWVNSKFGMLPIDATGANVNGKVGKFEHATNQLGRYGAAASGITPIMTTLNRYTAEVVLRRFESDVKGGQSTISLGRLGVMGLDQDSAAKVVGQFAKNGRNLDKWDPMIRSDFTTALGRWVGHVANEHDVGQMAAVMGTSMGRIMSQFRTFALSSYTNAVLYHSNQADATSLAVATTMLMGGLGAYVARTYADSAGKSDEDKQAFFADRFSTQKLAAGALHGSGVASVLPGLIDTATGVAGFKPMFDVRSTNLSQDLIGGAPLASYINNGYKALQGMTKPMHGKTFTQTDAMHVWHMFPFSSTLPGSYIANRAVQGFSKK